jgi:predicted DNA-binding protein
MSEVHVMISLRLSRELETRLNYLSLSSGVSKNSIISNAMSDYLKSVDLSNIPLDDDVLMEARGVKRFKGKELTEYLAKLAKIDTWISNNTFFTADPKTNTGECNGAVHGINIVIGFNDDNADGNINVIFKNLRQHNNYGVERHHLYVLSWDVWIKYMKEVNVLTG